MSEKFEKQPSGTSEHEDFKVISRWEFEIEGKRYDIKKVVELAKELPVEEVLTEKLDSMKEGEYWYDANRNRIKLQDIFELYEQTGGNWQAMMDTKPEYARHIKRISVSDYENDPIVLHGSADNFRLIDGLHRLTKAWCEEAETIQAQRFKKLPEEAVLRDEE